MTAASLLSSSLLTPIIDFFGVHHSLSVDEARIRNFRFQQGVTPLSSIVGVFLCVALYVGGIRLTQRWIKHRGKAFDLNWYVIFHNGMMSILSGVLWLALMAELFRVGSAHGLWSLACDPAGLHTGGTLYFIYFVNYIFKYVELVDTLLLALRGKPIPFLHIYHHAATLVLCWSQLWAQSCIQWLPIVINLLVHVVMYAYYTLHALRVTIWWKRIVTQIQIVQFVVALIGCLAAYFSRLLGQGLELLDPRVYGCHGTYEGAYVGIAVIASYLALFVQLYARTYKPKRVEPLSAAAQVEWRKRQVAAVQLHENGNGLHENGNGLHED